MSHQPFWPILVVVLTVFLIWGEDRSQNCLDKPCQHSAPLPDIKDKPVDLIDKAISGLYLNHTLVDWRRSLLVALLIGLLLFFILNLSNIPTGAEYFTVVLVIFLGIYLSCGYFLWIWFMPKDQEIIDGLLDIRSKIKHP